MLSIRLEPQYEEEWLGENPSSATFPLEEGKRPLRHQVLTYNAASPLIINAYNTGTGKTKAAFLRLKKRVEEKNYNLDSSEDNVLLIAPTNELLAQHARDAKDFCDQNGLPYPVVQDNDLGTWNAFGNQYWPADYLIDARGRVRDAHFGEGD